MEVEEPTIQNEPATAPATATLETQFTEARTALEAATAHCECLALAIRGFDDELENIARLVRRGNTSRVGETSTIAARKLRDINDLRRAENARRTAEAVVRRLSGQIRI